MSVLTANGQAIQPLTLATPLDEDGKPPVLRLVGFTASEGISRLFHYQLDVLADRTEKGIGFHNLLGEGITVTLTTRGALGTAPRQRHFHGICNRITQGESDNTSTRYRIELVPRMWRLEKTTQSRIFQQMPVPQILAEVLGPAAFILAGEFEPRDYCVQYRESDFAFASRLMEEEGIYYFFKHLADDHQLVLTNTPVGHRTFDLGERKLKTPKQGATPDFDTVFGWEKVQELRSGKVSLRDYCFELAPKRLTPDPVLPDTTVKVGEASHGLNLASNRKLELYDYPGAYAQRFDGVNPGGGDRADDLKKIFPDGDRTTELRMELETVQGLAIHGGSTVPAFAPGFQFTLATLPGDGRARSHRADGMYLLTEVTHTTRQSGGTSGQRAEFHYDNTFKGIPLALPYRPRRVTPKPFVQGPQTAFVVGPTNDEIAVDKYGRVKIKFHWDRDPTNDLNSSCWIRVAQVWAGKRWGASFWPRVGQEVIVSFLEGDPDQPIITGSVYNADQMPPYLGNGLDPKHKNDPKVSGIKTCSTPGGHGYNEIRFDDTKGKEQVFLRSQGALDFRARGSHQATVGGSSHLIVGGDAREKVGRNKLVEVGEQLHMLAPDCFLGTKGICFISSKQHFVAFGKDLAHVQGGQRLLLGSDTIIKLKCGASSITLTPEGVWIDGPKVSINSGSAPPANKSKFEFGVLDGPAAADESKPGFVSNPKPAPAAAAEATRNGEAPDEKAVVADWKADLQRRSEEA